MGDKGGKSDMDRVGVFQEMGYITISDKYKQPGSVQFNESAMKGKQLLPGGTKIKSALQAGYFTDKFGRVLEGEAYSDPIKLRRQQRLKEGQKNIGKAFLPSSGDKKMSGLGNHYGTLGGPVSAFSPVKKPGKERKGDGKNVITNPGKRGTGFGPVHGLEVFCCGYVICVKGLEEYTRGDPTVFGLSYFIGITIGPYPPYQGDRFDKHKEIAKKEIAAHKNATKGGAFRLNMHPRAYFDANPYNSDKLPRRSGSASLPSKKDDVKPFKPSSPGKKPGGSKLGTFDPYPSHSADPYKVKINRPVNIVNKSGKTFMPSQGPKSVPMVSIINQNVMKSVNPSNYRSMTCMTF